MDNHYRMTKQRETILDVLKRSGVPLTAEDIAGQCTQQKHVLALSTIYRNLEKLTGLGSVQKALYPDGIARYELTGQHHHYLICTVCNRIQTIDACPLQQLETGIALATGFEITGHQMNLFGRCPACRQTGGGPAASRPQIPAGKAHETAD